MDLDMEPFVMDELVFMTVAGSRLYGTDTPESDVDKRGVCVPPKEVVFGFGRNFNQQVFPDSDTTVFSLMKFIQLAADCNPNVMELLFVPDGFAEVSTPTWLILREVRSQFLSAKAFHTFTGYAFSQLKRIKSHREWLLNPPKHKPTRKEFGLGESSFSSADLKGHDDVPAVVMEILKKEKAYKSAMTGWTQYQGWKKSRNSVRAALEEKHGYDTKHAMHLMRLLRMGKEVLTEATMHVRRPDAKELLEIRNGEWSYEKLLGQADELNSELTEIYENKSYVVPFSVNRQELSDFAIELHEWHWNMGKK